MNIEDVRMKNRRVARAAALFYFRPFFSPQLHFTKIILTFFVIESWSRFFYFFTLNELSPSYGKKSQWLIIVNHFFC